jgi:excisionase family DNA binding protein
MNSSNASVIREGSVAVGAVRHLTVAGAAKELGLAESTIRAWIAQRRKGHVRLGRAIRIPASEIERIVQSGFMPARRS